VGRGFTREDLPGSRVHPAPSFGVFDRVTRRDPPTVHKVVQHAQIQTYTDLVQHSLKASVEGFTVLRHNKSSSDGTQSLLWYR
jgi:hypothetical protein